MDLLSPNSYSTTYAPGGSLVGLMPTDEWLFLAASKNRHLVAHWTTTGRVESQWATVNLLLNQTIVETRIS